MKSAHVLIIVSLFFLFSACDNGNSPPESPGNTSTLPEKSVQEGKIVALGDSLTAGLGVDLDKSYPSQLEEKLDANGYQYRVINAGVSGETSSGTLSRLDWILSQNPDIIVLVIGANDGLRGIDTSLVYANIDKILTELSRQEVIVVLGGMKMVWNLGDAYTEKFNDIYPSLAEQHSVIFMPFFLEGVAAEASLNRADGIHPNAQGYARIVENLYPYVVQAIEKRTVLMAGPL